METTEKNEKSQTKGQFFGILFHARDYAHLKHLEVAGQGAYAKHIHLQQFYQDILPIIDEFVESCQSDGLIDIVIPTVKTVVTTEDFFSALLQYIKSYRKVFTESWEQNILDQISAIIHRLTYKLKYLK